MRDDAVLRRALPLGRGLGRLCPGSSSERSPDPLPGLVEGTEREKGKEGPPN